MRRRSAFILLAMAASACGSAAGPNSQPTALASGADPRCETVVDMFVGPNNLITDSEGEVFLARIGELLELIDEPTADRWNQLTDLSSAAADPNFDFGPEGVMGIYDAAEDATFAACGIPLLTAVSAMTPTFTLQLCDADTLPAGTDPFEVPLCAGDEPEFPKYLPCFAATDTAQSQFEARYDAVDCDTGESVSWDSSVSQWMPRDD